MKVMLGVAAIAPLVFFLLGCLFLVWPVRKNRILRAVMLIFAAFASFKTLFFLVIGGSVMAPDLPAQVQLVYGMLQNAYFFMLGFAVIGGALLFILRRILNRRVLGAAGFLLVIAIFGFALGIKAGLNAVAEPEISSYDIFSERFSNIPDGYKIVQLSDLHMGINITPEMIKRIVAQTNAQHPDLIVITGDLVDGLPNKLRDDVALLKNLKATDGVYIVNGNHEYYADVSQWTPVWGEYGLNLLNNKSVVLSRNGQSFMALAGVADRQATRVKAEAPNFDKALAGIPANLPVVLLEHRPQDFKERAQKADLMLSGHTHGGMVVGLDRLVAALNGGYVSGLYREGTSTLIVSRGTYLWGGFLARLGTTGEIGVITLHKARHSSLPNGISIQNPALVPSDSDKEAVSKKD